MRARPYWALLVAAVAAIALAAAGRASGSTSEAWLVTKTSPYKGVKGSVALNQSWAFAGFAAGGTFSTVRIENVLNTSPDARLVQAGPMRSHGYRGGKGCTFPNNAGHKLVIEDLRESSVLLADLYTSRYRCRVIDHPTGDVEDPIEIKIYRNLSSANCWDVYAEGSLKSTRCVGAFTGYGVVATGIARRFASSPPEYVVGEFNIPGDTDLSVTTGTGDTGWIPVTPHNLTFLKWDEEDDMHADRSNVGKPQGFNFDLYWIQD
jgi:hypothetical protein